MGDNEILQQILNELKTTNKRLGQLEQGQSDIKQRLDGVFEQTVGLTEFRTETKQQLDDIHQEMNGVKSVTKENLYDIAKLKSMN